MGASLIIGLAIEAGKLAAAALASRGKPGAADLVNQAAGAAARIREALAAEAATATNGELTAADVHAAFEKAHAEAQGLIADATKGLVP